MITHFPSPPPRHLNYFLEPLVYWLLASPRPGINLLDKLRMSQLTHKQPRSEVTGGVQGIATVKAETDAEPEDREAGHPGRHGGARGRHHVPLVRHRADGERQQRRGQHLVPGPAQVRQVGRGEGGEDGGGVGDGAEHPVLVLIPDQGVPVEEEHQGPAHQRPQVLRGEVVNHAAPGEPAHTRQGHRDGGVEVTSGHAAAYDDPEEYSDGPPADIMSLKSPGLHYPTQQHGSWRKTTDYLPEIN